LASKGPELPKLSYIAKFDKTFEVKTNVSDDKIGAVLQQQRHPISFVGKKLGLKWQKLFVRKKELLVMVFVVQKLEQYLLHGKTSYCHI